MGLSADQRHRLCSIASEHDFGFIANGEDLELDVIMRIYAPDLERFATWTPPVARKLN